MNTVVESSTDVQMSQEMYSFCYEHALELAEAYNSALHAGLEEVAAFNPVMDDLCVPRSQQERLFLQTMAFKDFAGLTNQRLSPVNQFMTALVPYIAWCFRNRLPTNSPLRDEAAKLLEDARFPQYLGKEIGWKASQEIRGALRTPSKVAVVSILILVPIAVLLLWPSVWHVVHHSTAQWVIWIVSLIWAILCVGTFLAECFRTEAHHDGPEKYLSAKMRRLITGINAFGVVSALCITALTDVSKIHLLWGVPLLLWGPRVLSAKQRNAYARRQDRRFQSCLHRCTRNSYLKKKRRS